MSFRSILPSISSSYIDLTFLKNLLEYENSKPYYISGPLPENQENVRTNIQYETLYRVPLSNVRGFENKLSLARHGFQIMKIPNDVNDLDIRGNQKQDYVEKITGLVEKELGAPFVMCYDCRFRSSSSNLKNQEEGLIGTPGRPDTPAEAAHIDITMEAAMKRARRHLTEEEARMYLHGGWRLRIINVWKPFDTVRDYDLLLCDHSTVHSSDLVAVDRVSTEYVGEVYMLKPRDTYDWYWMELQRSDEATVFLSFDSNPNGGARYCPHTSAKNAKATSATSPRESVELRLMVISALQ